ncbi:MAG: Uma2 family endonuclease [Synechococcales bacterium]|nr:Uma2 family endonuclease [Synechococcales bacterium]
MVQTPPRSLTLEAFLKLPETKPASEFIGGQILQKPMPQGKHTTLQGDLVSAINTQLKGDRIARAYPELRCTFGGRSLVPDIAIFIWHQIPRDETGKVANVFATAPDWTIEILSPDQSQTKVVRNILHWLSHGTQMGWLVDSEEELVFVYFADSLADSLQEGVEQRAIAVFEQSEECLPVPAFAAAFQLTVGQLFSWLEA